MKRLTLIFDKQSGSRFIAESEHGDYVLHSEAQARILALEAALRDLLQEIDCLNDIEMCRDIPYHEAEANWNNVLDTAQRVLNEKAKA